MQIDMIRMRSYTYTALAALASTVSMFSCSSEESFGIDDEDGGAAGGFHVVSRSTIDHQFRVLPAPAAGDIVAVHATEDGDLVCTKADGGPWTSELGGHVLFYLREEGATWTLADVVGYAPQFPNENGDYELYDIVSEKAVVVRAEEANYETQCVAFPYIDIPIAHPWESCPGPGDTETVCARSGIYSFSLVADEGELLPADTTAACGEGTGQANGNVLCVPMMSREAAIYPFPFKCDIGGVYKVDVRFTQGDGTLHVADAEFRNYGPSNGEHSLDFAASSSTSTCVAIVNTSAPSKFSLKVKKTSPGSSSGMFDDPAALVRSSRPGDILIRSKPGELCNWFGGQYALFPRFCHAGIVTSSWPNFLTAEAIGPGQGVIEYDSFDYWANGDGTEVVQLRVPGASGTQAARRASELVDLGLPYGIGGGVYPYVHDDGAYEYTSFYCTKLVHAAYLLIGKDIYHENLGGGAGLFLPDELMTNPHTKIVGYYSSLSE